MNKSRRIISIFFISLIFIFSVLNISAHEADTSQRLNPKISSGSEIVPYVYTVCNGLPHHEMHPRGYNGIVYLSNGSLYLSGNPWQCKNCYLVMVTEGDYYINQMSVIGKYAIATVNYPTSAYGVVIKGPNSYGYCGSNKLSGYLFYPT